MTLMQNMLRYVAILAIGLLPTHAYAQEPPALKTETDKLSYALGATIGKDLRDQSVEVTPELLLMGIDDVLSGGQMLMSEQEVKARVNAFRQEVRQQLVLATKKLAEENERKGAEFLEANKKQEKVVALESGLQYKILKQGDGSKPTINNRVVVHYRGTLIDGTEFDSSYARSQPMTFAVKQLIGGWREALQLMPVGSKWQLFIPPQLAYGLHGMGRQIGPNSTLIFDLELIAIEGKGASGGGAQVAEAGSVEGAGGGTAEGAQSATELADLVVSFKLDPRLLGGTYGQPGWVTPQTYQGIGGQDTVEAKVDGLDAKGRPIKGIKAEWIPEDPDMVTVSAGEENSVKIFIRGPGQSNLKVVSGDISKTLSIKATSKNDILQIEISQL